MPELIVDEQVAVDPAPEAEPSSFELALINAIRQVPGFRGVAASPRMFVALRGGIWTMLGYGAGQVFRLASTLILARLIAPQAFGLVALVSVFLSGLEMLSDLGIGMDVVQHRRGDDPVFINTAFLIQAGRGFVIWLIAASLAYPFAIFYHQPAVIALAVVGSVSVLLRGLASGSVWTLTRHVKLRELTFLNTGTDFFGFVVSVVWAAFSPTAWALVVGRVAGALALTVASHVIAESQVSRKWDSQAAREIFAFGAGIFLSTATYFLAGEAERLVVGKFVTLVELGCFSLALAISSAVSKGLLSVNSQVFFPMISDSIREDREQADRHFKRARRLILALSLILSVGFTIGGKWAVKLLLGQKYLMAGWMLQLLGVRGALELFTSVPASMLFALGTSRYAAVGNVVKLTFLAAGLWIAFGHFGFYEALWVLTIAPLANYIVILVGVRRHCAGVLRAELLSFSMFALVTVGVMLLSGVIR
jgi:O-antigen/teichoic acid export membrane protein